MFTRRAFVLAAAVVATIGGPATAETVQVPEGAKLIIVRHADRSGEDLNSKGIARAKALVTALDGTHVDAIYTLGIKRNLDTAAPLAEARGLPVKRIPHNNYARRILEGNAGKTVVWVGNKGNLADIWKDLAAPGRAPLEYGDLFIVERGANGAAKVTRRTFGAELDS